MAKHGTQFVISDTHFGHENSWAKFKRADGEPLRPFSSTEEMDEAMIDRWNSKVKPSDTVYHLGDVAIGRRHIEQVKRLNGHKRLIMGNHDPFDNKFYYEAGFEKLCGVRVFVDKFILSHIPQHPDCVTDRFRVNVHGHLHANEVMREVRNDVVIGTLHDGSNVYGTKDEIDPRYLCVSVEHTDYAPLSFDEVEERVKSRWEATGYTGPVNSWGNRSRPR